MDISTQINTLRPQTPQSGAHATNGLPPSAQADFEKPQTDSGNALYDRAVEKSSETTETNPSSTPPKEADTNQQAQSARASEENKAAREKAADEKVVQAQEQQELQQVRELSARDREVRAHEQAHAAVGGKYAGAPTYDYQRGPDGKQYAVGGEVSISTSPIEGDPEATLEKAQTIRRAALAPAEPSGQDRAVAAQASQMAAQAMVEIAEMRAEQANTSSSESEQTNSNIRVNGEAAGNEESETNNAPAISTNEQVQVRQYTQATPTTQQNSNPLTQSGEVETPAPLLGSLIDGYA